MTKLTQNSWLGGQMDVRMTGRQDMKNYRNGASVLKNFVPVKLGSVRKRPGTDLVCDLTDFLCGQDSGRDPASTKFRMIPFGFLSGEGFVLVIVSDASGNCAARAYRAKASDPGDGSTAAGCGSYVPVGGTISYKADELDQIGYVQCGDIVFLAHQKHHPKKIEHNLNGTTHAFAISNVDFTRTNKVPTLYDGWVRRCYLKPYQRGAEVSERYKASAILRNASTGEEYETNPSRVYSDGEASGEGPDKVARAWKIALTPLVEQGLAKYTDPIPDWFYDQESELTKAKWEGTTYGSPWTDSQTITMSVSITPPSGWSVGKYRIYKDAGGVFGLIGENESGTFVDNNITPDTSVTPIDTTGGAPFSSIGNYPGSVGLYQQRLVWAGTEKDPARIWMSRAGDLYEYRQHERLQPDDAIDFILPITQFANINFIVELGRLFAFAECTELVIGSNSDSAGVSYETIMASEHSHLGCTKRLPPIVANNTLLFVNRTGQSVRDYDERVGSSRFGGTDVSVFAAGVFADNPIVDWTWQQEPNSTVWCVLGDGRLASFTYDKEQEIAAWAVHELGGGGKARGIAKTCAVFGREAGRPTTGEVMVAVERGEGAARKVTLERMRPWVKGYAANYDYERNPDWLCMDSMEPGDKSSEGKTYLSEFDVSGYIFESVMTTMPPVIGDQVGQAQFDVKLGQHAHLRLIDSVGGEVFAVGMENAPSTILEDGPNAVRTTGLVTQDVDVVLAGSNNRDGRVTVRHEDPGPFQLALLELDYEAER